MAPPNDPASSPDGNHDRLNGWKDIAACLGKSVRTAQRWEQELRLPVHRIHTAGGEIVYASRRELDEWLQRVGESRPETPPPETVLIASNGRAAEQGGARAAPTATPGAAPRRLRLLVPLLLIVIIGALALVLVVNRRGERPPIPGTAPASAVGGAGQPASWKVHGDTLTVFDANGQTLWRYRFESPLREELYGPKGDLQGTPTVILEDLDDDGRIELLIRTFPASHTPPYQLLCFEADGRLRFTYDPPASVRFGDTNYGAPFSIVQFIVAKDEDRRATIWAVAQHYQEFPTLVLKIGPHGERRAEYWMNGHSLVLKEATFNGQRVILLGGTSNETWGGSLTVLDYDRPGGSAPAATRKYRCSSCPAGWPLAYFVFPKTEVCAKAGERAYVWEIHAEPSDRIRVAVLQGSVLPGDASPIRAMTYYALDGNLRIVNAEFGDDYHRAHVRLEAAGMLDHSLGPRDERELFPVLSWDGTRFVEIEKPER